MEGKLHERILHCMVKLMEHCHSYTFILNGTVTGVISLISDWEVDSRNQCNCLVSGFQNLKSENIISHIRKDTKTQEDTGWSRGK